MEEYNSRQTTHQKRVPECSIHTTVFHIHGLVTQTRARKNVITPEILRAKLQFQLQIITQILD